jgi:hypothetical protein
MPDNVLPFPGKPQNDGGVASGGSGPHDPNMEARVAVLEQIAKQTSETLVGIRTDLASIKSDLKTDLGSAKTEVRTGLEAARDRHDRDFRLTFSVIIMAALGLAGLMAKGFKWL